MNSIQSKLREVKLVITSEDAEIIHYALMLRRLQKTIQKSTSLVDQAQYLAEYFEGVAIKAFNWDPAINRTEHYKQLIKSVTIKGYDLPPKGGC